MKHGGGVRESTNFVIVASRFDSKISNSHETYALETFMVGQYRPSMVIASAMVTDELHI